MSRYFGSLATRYTLSSQSRYVSYSTRIRVRFLDVNNFGCEPLNSKPLLVAFTREIQPFMGLRLQQRYDADISHTLFRIATTISAFTK